MPLALYPNEALAPTLALDHEQAVSFSADDCEAVTVVEAQSALVDSEHSQADWLSEFRCFLNDLLQQFRANAKALKWSSEVQLHQPEVSRLNFHGHDAHFVLAADDDAVRQWRVVLSMLLPLLVVVPFAPGLNGVLTHGVPGDFMDEMEVAMACWSERV
jgi:hypothetical protein